MLFCFLLMLQSKRVPLSTLVGEAMVFGDQELLSLGCQSSVQRGGGEVVNAVTGC